MPPSPDALALNPPVQMPLWGQRDATATQAVLSSPYADTYKLARSWVAGAHSPYDAVRSIQDHLRSGYEYDPNVPSHTFPLESFLFSDRAGYCQQFAGTMALMLRMTGIPARVVSGFAPGSLDPSSGTYEVHDTDAHSWVEVYFRGIGWVTFDPTPDVAPAESQRLGGDFAAEFRGPAPNPVEADVNARGGKGELKSSPAAPTATSESDAWSPASTIAIVVLALGLVGFGAVALRRRRRLLSGEHTEAQVAELTAALARAGWRIGPRTTLLAIEGRATGVARRAIREYAAALRGHRYAASPQSPPGPSERRAVRRAIAGSGLRSRLRALLSIPPGGPARP